MCAYNAPPKSMRRPFMPVPQELFDFLTDLSANNNREWFAANKHRYEAHVKAPLLRLIEDYSLPLSQISPHCRAVPKVGGSLFRIYRDIRFSKDKSPYKTQAGVHFRHEAGKNAHAPGFYLHLAPEECFAAAGIWGPDLKTLTMIRQAIVDDTPRWVAVKEKLSGHFDLSDHLHSLKRTPRGFDRNHPCADDLRRRHFVAARQLKRDEVLDPEFLQILAAAHRQGALLMEFLTRAIGLPW